MSQHSIPLAEHTLAWRWRQGQLQAIEKTQALPLANLLNIDRQKLALRRNTEQFVRGLPANHVLLTGARGTGKSSLVKALLHEFSHDGLRLIEVPPHDLIDLPDIVAPLRGRAEKFILYVDDFSVASNDPALIALKTALDGGVEEAPDNVLIYATSNRRYLMPSLKSDNAEYQWIDDEVHPGESVEEKISLSERFGLWLSFLAFDQTEYLNLVQHHLQQLGYTGWNDQVRGEALRWAQTRASRSGRVAMQFARDWSGRQQLSLSESIQ
ncbi:MAG: ATP-binding protein [Pseudomonadota bacterium]